MAAKMEISPQAQKPKCAVTPNEDRPFCFLNEPEKLAKNLYIKDGEDRLKKIAQQLSRPVARNMPTIQNLNNVRELSRKMPNTRELCEFLEMAISAVLYHGAKRFTIPPILLLGPPGTGKTYCLSKVCEAGGIPSYALSMSSMNASFALTGLERGWGNSRPGALARIAATSTCCNPAFHLDEIDKSNFVQEGNRDGIENALLALLEPDTAASIEDLHLEATLNMSEISFLATANSLTPLPAPVKSRFTIIRMDELDAAAMCLTTEDILNKVISMDLRIPSLKVEVDSGASQVLDGVTPRLIRNQGLRILFPHLSKKSEDGIIRIFARDLAPYVGNSTALKAREIGFHATH